LISFFDASKIKLDDTSIEALLSESSAPELDFFYNNLQKFSASSTILSAESCVLLLLASVRTRVYCKSPWIDLWTIK
jgi:hypothetical protein